MCPIFKVMDLSAGIKKEMVQQGVWAPSCPIALNRLALVRVAYYDFEEVVHDDGEIVVLDSVASDVLNIFKTLYDQRFPISKIRRMERYGGSDGLSMQDNNTSGFNFRKIAGSSRLSAHSYGLAIDVNPHQNPYVSPDHEGFAKILPALGSDYLNRKNVRPGMVESIVDIFDRNGFSMWGGEWDSPIDWHHFQVPYERVRELMGEGG